MERISDWTYQWKIMFSAKLIKHSQEVFFSLKAVKSFQSLLRNVLPTIYKLFVGQYLDYVDIVYYPQNNQRFLNNNVALAITNAINEISKVKPYKEIGNDSHSFPWCCRRLFAFYKRKTEVVTKCLYKLIFRDTFTTH